MAALPVLTIVSLAAIHAQPAASFRARLSPLPVTGATVNTITGAGSATATLQGSRLVIEGTFSGLAGPATSAAVRRGPKAVPGPVVAEFTVPSAPSGRFTATIDLSPADVEGLRTEQLYVQIHSERAPEGSIRGWLLPSRP
jgi:hypothetical protein